MRKILDPLWGLSKSQGIAINLNRSEIQDVARQYVARYVFCLQESNFENTWYEFAIYFLHFTSQDILKSSKLNKMKITFKIIKYNAFRWSIFNDCVRHQSEATWPLIWAKIFKAYRPLIKSLMICSTNFSLI